MDGGEGKYSLAGLSYYEILVQKLLEAQLLPEIVGKALKIFKGKMIRLV